MIGAPPFPRSIDELDPAFVSAALGVEVRSIRTTQIGVDRGMLGDIFLVGMEDVTPSADTGGCAAPKQLVAKFASPREGSLASAKRGGTHERELRCYDELLRDTPVAAPELFGAWYDPDTAEFLILQQAIEADESVDQLVGLSVEQAKMVLTQAACVHARWFEDETLRARAWLPPIDGPGRRHNLTSLANAGWDPLCAVLGDAISDDERLIGIGLADRIDATLVELGHHPATLVHGDLRADNLLFSADGNHVFLIDWQGAGVAPASWDLAYFMSQSLSVDVRRAHEDELLDHYRQQLEEQGLQLRLEDILVGYAESMLFGLVVACALPVVNDTDEPRVNALAHTFARRAIEALRDHNPFWEGAS